MTLIYGGTIIKKIILAILTLLSFTIFANTLPKKIIVARDEVLYPPMEFYQGDKLTGFHVELVEEIAKRLGIAVEWVEVPWRRALNMVETGNADGITYIGKNPERERWAIFKDGNTISSGTFSFLIRRTSRKEIKFDGTNEKELLQNRTLLMVGGFTLPKNISELNSKKHEALRITNLVDMLRASRYDIAIVNKDDYLNLYAGTDTEEYLSILEPPVYSFANYIAFSKAKNLDFLAQKFEEEMLKFKATKEYEDLKKKFGI